MKKWTGSHWFIFTVILAFASIISFYQVNSYWADTHKFNGLFGWIGIGVMFGLAAIFGLYKTIKNSN